MSEKRTTEQANLDSETCSTTPKRLRKGTAEKKLHDLQQHALKAPCDCTKQCLIKIPQLHRIRIWTEFWNLRDYDARRSSMYQLIERKPIKGNNEHRARNNFISYYFKNKDGVRQKVCKTFFLSTLGYGPSSSVIDSLIRSTPSGALCATPDARGGRRKEHCADHDLIGKHIESYNPAMPHYRKAHAPKRRYLPSELTIKEMHDDYQAKHPSCQTSYRTYQRIMKELNISIAKRNK